MEVGAHISAQHLRQRADVIAECRDQHLSRRSRQLFLALGIDKFELRKRIAVERHDLVVEKAKGVDHFSVLEFIGSEVVTFFGLFAGARQVAQVAQIHGRVLEEDAALQDPREDATGTESVVDLVFGDDGRVETLTISDDGVVLEILMAVCGFVGRACEHDIIDWCGSGVVWTEQDG